MPHDVEQKIEAGRKGGQEGRSHGVYAIKARGKEALDADQRQTLREIEQQLTTPEGVEQALLQRVGMAMVIMGVLERYLKEQVNSGVPLDGITIFRSWPAFQNASVRALALLRSMMPNVDPASHAKLVEEMTARVEKFASGGANAQGKPPVPDDLEAVKMQQEQPGSDPEEELL